MRFLAICIWYLVYGECKYATGLSLHAISYFILFYLLRLFIYLLCAVLKAQIKESPRHRLGQSRLTRMGLSGAGQVLLPFNIVLQHCWESALSLSLPLA